MAGESFVGLEVAVAVVVASVILAGILVGVGRALGTKRIEHFGFEELIQSIINSAIIGSFAAVKELVGAVSSSSVTGTCAPGGAIEQLSCTLVRLNGSLFAMMGELVRMLDLMGYYQRISLDFGAFAVEPFSNLSAVSDLLSSQLLSLNLIIILVELNSQMAAFIGQNALALLFPVGLVLRTLFATRKVGGFLIALAIGLYIFYPAFILIFPDPEPQVLNATLQMGNLTANPFYASAPVIDLNGNYAIAAKLDLLSGRCRPADFNITNETNTTQFDNSTMCDDFLFEQNLTSNVTQNMSMDFTGDTGAILQMNTGALSRTALYAVVAPLFSIIVTVVFVRELSSILGSEIGIRSLASI